DRRSGSECVRTVLSSLCRPLPSRSVQPSRWQFETRRAQIAQLEWPAEVSTTRAGWCAGFVPNRASFGRYRLPWHLSGTEGSGARLPRPLRLNRRTRHRAVRAEDAAISLFGLESRPAAGALIKELTRVRGHSFRPRRMAVRTRDDGLQDHRLP